MGWYIWSKVNKGRICTNVRGQDIAKTVKDKERERETIFPIIQHGTLSSSFLKQDNNSLLNSGIFYQAISTSGSKIPNIPSQDGREYSTSLYYKNTVVFGLNVTSKSTISLGAGALGFSP